MYKHSCIHRRIRVYFFHLFILLFICFSSSGQDFTSTIDKVTMIKTKTFIDIYDPQLDLTPIGKQMYALVETLYPICRSITGNGVRETMSHVQKLLSITVHEVPTGTPVFDWTVPKEWNIKDAYVANSQGERVIDFKKSNLHLLNYSTPVNQKMTLAELRPHLMTLPEHPARLIPQPIRRRRPSL